MNVSVFDLWSRNKRKTKLFETILIDPKPSSQWWHSPEILPIHFHCRPANEFWMRPIALSWHGNVHFPHANSASTPFEIAIDWKVLRSFHWLCRGRHFSTIASSSTASKSPLSASSRTVRCRGHCHRTFSPTAWSASVCPNPKWTAFSPHNIVCHCSGPTVAYRAPNYRCQWMHTIVILVRFRRCDASPLGAGASHCRSSRCTAADRRNAFRCRTIFGRPELKQKDFARINIFVYWFNGEAVRVVPAPHHIQTLSHTWYYSICDWTKC